jgi:hypothetical protein
MEPELQRGLRMSLSIRLVPARAKTCRLTWDNAITAVQPVLVDSADVSAFVSKS